MRDLRPGARACRTQTLNGSSPHAIHFCLPMTLLPETLGAQLPSSASEALPTSPWRSLVAQVILICFLACPPYYFTLPDLGIYSPSAWNILPFPCPGAPHSLLPTLLLVTLQKLPGSAREAEVNSLSPHGECTFLLCSTSRSTWKRSLCFHRVGPAFCSPYSQCLALGLAL